MLSNAVSQFKKYKSPRMKRFLSELELSLVSCTTALNIYPHYNEVYFIQWYKWEKNIITQETTQKLWREYGLKVCKPESCVDRSFNVDDTTDIDDITGVFFSLLGLVTSDYRKEKWWSLLTAVLSTSLR